MDFEAFFSQKLIVFDFSIAVPTQQQIAANTLYHYSPYKGGFSAVFLSAKWGWHSPDGKGHEPAAQLYHAAIHQPSEPRKNVCRNWEEFFTICTLAQMYQ